MHQVITGNFLHTALFTKTATAEIYQNMVPGSCQACTLQQTQNKAPVNSSHKFGACRQRKSQSLLLLSQCSH